MKLANQMLLYHLVVLNGRHNWFTKQEAHNNCCSSRVGTFNQVAGSWKTIVVTWLKKSKVTYKATKRRAKCFAKDDMRHVYVKIDFLSFCSETLPLLSVFEKRAVKLTAWKCMLEIGTDFKVPVCGYVKVHAWSYYYCFNVKLYQWLNGTHPSYFFARDLSSSSSSSMQLCSPE